MIKSSSQLGELNEGELTVSKDDWRRMGQEEYLMETELQYVGSYIQYSATWEHEHCCFYTAKISTYD